MRTVYVLGAGASHFAGFPLGGHLLPFLQSEFKSADHMTKGLGKYALDFIEKVKSLLPENRLLSTGEPDLEFVLSLVDLDNQNASNVPEFKPLINDLEMVARKLNLEAWDSPRIKRGFAALVASAFQYKSCQLLSKDAKIAHENFSTISATWAAHLNPGDTLITFNWDLLQEILLFRAGKWSCEDGYGMQLISEKLLKPSQITILKMHGSCNWALRHGEDRFLQIDYSDVFFGPDRHKFCDPELLGSTSDYGDSLIIPSYLKDPLRVNILNSVWKSAASVLREAENLVILGYSLPAPDMPARRLFSEMMNINRKLKSITLVLHNDEESYNRWETLFGKYRSICKIIRYKFEEFILDINR